MPSDVAAARGAVAVVGWLRRHPGVESGPSVRAAVAFAELAVAWQEVSGGRGDLLPAALASLPHRVRVRPGVDADVLVRRAVALVESEAGLLGLDLRIGAGAADDETADDDASGDPLVEVAVATPSERHVPEVGGGKPDPFVFTADEARRLVDDLLPPGAPWPLSAGPAPTRPARNGAGDEVLAARPFRPGDRCRDLSVRHSVRASLRRAAAGGPEAGTPRMLDPRALRVLTRRAESTFDVVFALDVSASMGRSERPLVAPATTALAGQLVREGHRVGAVVFSEEALVVRNVSRSRVPLSTDGYAFAHATNVEAGIEAGRRLLHRQRAADARAHVIVVSDAETTSHDGTDEAWGADGAPRGFAGMARLLNGGMLDAARRAALLAAARCAGEGITVSVVYPDERSEVDFAHALAAAGGGRARVLRSG